MATENYKVLKQIPENWNQIEGISCTNFSYDEDLSKYSDSMLFDSGHMIASADFKYKDKEYSLDLKVCGDINVTYKGEVYKTPSEFPEELKELITKNPGKWELNDDVFVNFNNWFEFIVKGIDGFVYEEDLSEASPEELYEDFLIIVKLIGDARDE